MDITSKEKMFTPAQVVALVKVYNRAPIYETKEHAEHDIRMSFEDWIKRDVSPSFDDVIMVQWAGMYLGIEPDGYTHS